MKGLHQELKPKEDGLLSMLVQTLLASPVTLGFLIVMWAWTATEFLWLLVYGATPLWNATFTLTSEHPLYVWTWVTAIFSHGGVLHLAVNSFVLASFGPLVEKHLGRRRYLFALLVGGVFAGLAQIGAGLLIAETVRVVGASGAIAAVLAIYATAEPDVPVYLFFFIPMPIWVTILVLILGSSAVVIAFGVLAFNIAHIAHAAGAAFGLVIGLSFDSKPVYNYFRSLIGAGAR